jgi:hypothetical protein
MHYVLDADIVEVRCSNLYGRFGLGTVLTLGQGQLQVLIFSLDAVEVTTSFSLHPPGCEVLIGGQEIRSGGESLLIDKVPQLRCIRHQSIISVRTAHRRVLEVFTALLSADDQGLLTAIKEDLSCLYGRL